LCTRTERRPCFNCTILTQAIAALRTLMTLLLSTPAAAKTLFGPPSASGSGSGSARVAIAAVVRALDPVAAFSGALGAVDEPWVLTSSCSISRLTPATGSVKPSSSIPSSSSAGLGGDAGQKLAPAAELAAALREALVAHAAVAAFEVVHTSAGHTPMAHGGTAGGAAVGPEARAQASAAVYSLAAMTALSPPGPSGPGTSAPRQAALLALSASPRAVQVRDGSGGAV
jgi:hypothetical protein